MNNYLNGIDERKESFSTSIRIIAIYWILVCFPFFSWEPSKLVAIKLVLTSGAFQAISSSFSSCVGYNAVTNRKNEIFFMISCDNELRDFFPYSWNFMHIFPSLKVTCITSENHRASDRDKSEREKSDGCWRFNGKKVFYHRISVERSSS